MKKNETCNQIPKEITELGVLCAMHDNYTPQEQKYIFMLEVFDQPGIREVIRQKAHHGQLDLSQFKHTTCARRLEVPFKALEPLKSHYQLLENALNGISHKQVDLAYTMPDPKDITKHIVMYQQADQLFQYVGSIKKGQVKYAIIDIPFKVMQLIGTIDLGYHKIMPSLYLAFHHQSTRRLYQLAETRIMQGYYHFKPSTLFALLSTKASYRGIGNLCYHKIDVAVDEFKQAYMLKMVNYYIAYNVIYGKNKYIGKYPNCVEFSIHYREEDIDEMPEKVKNELGYRRHKTKQILIEYWKVREWVADDISQKITPAYYDSVRLCFQQAYRRRDESKEMGMPLHNPAGYIIAALKKALQIETPKKQ